MTWRRIWQPPSRRRSARHASTPPCSPWTATSANSELAIGKHLHDAYSAGEKALERVIELVDGELPPGRSFHRDLIRRAAQPQEGVRQAIISEDTAAALLQLVAFRHVFRHVYGGFTYALAAPNVPVAAEALPRPREEVTRFAAGFDAPPAA